MALGYLQRSALATAASTSEGATRLTSDGIDARDGYQRWATKPKDTSLRVVLEAVVGQPVRGGDDRCDVQQLIEA